MERDVIDAAIFVRMHYPDGAQARWRMVFFESMVLPRIRAQCDYPVYVRCNDWQERQVEDMGCISWDVGPEYKDWVKPGYEKKAEKYHVDFVPWEGTMCSVGVSPRLPRYELQIAIDSDDLLLPGAIALLEHTMQMGTETEHWSMQPMLFDLKEMRKQEHYITYNRDKGSPFYALWQPKDRRDYVFIYDDSHLRIGKQMERASFCASPLLLQTVHEHNASTRMLRRK